MIQGSYTAIQEMRADAVIRQHLHVVRDRVRQQIPARLYRGLVLFGGYGRGEGGVQLSDDGPVPHNNYDLLVITGRTGRLMQSVLTRRLHALARALGKQLGIGVDLSTLSTAALRSAPAQIFWYDVRRMHKVLDGPADLMSAIPAYRQTDVSAEEQARLLLNRSTLLAINRWLLQVHGERVDAHHLRTLRKHTVKAILGYGDAVLLARGRYVVSYRAKVDALNKLDEACVSSRFRELHRWATEFRFRPRYDTLSVEQEAARLQEVLTAGERIAHWFESRRLGPLADDWSDYLSRFVESGRRRAAGGTSLIGFVRAMARNVVAHGTPPWRDTRTLYWWRCPPYHRVLAVAPAALYDTCSPSYRAAAAHLISTSEDELVAGYVRTWARVLDPNAAPVLQRLGLTGRSA